MSLWSSFTRSEWDAPIGRSTRAADKRPKIIDLSEIQMWTATYAHIQAEEAAAAEAAESSTNSPSASGVSASASGHSPRSRSQSRSKSATRGKSPRDRLGDIYSHAFDGGKADTAAAAAPASSSDERKTNADPTAAKADSDSAAKADASAMQDVEGGTAEVGPATAAAAAAAASSAAASTAAPAAAAAAAEDEDLPVDPHSVDVASALDLDSITTDTENRADLYDKFFKPNADLNAKVRLYRGDITKLRVDAIVNAANSGLWAGGGICGAIFDAAGEERLKRACRVIRQAGGDVPPGETRLTRGFLLPAPFILHTVGPMDGDELDLIRSYQSTLDMCAHPILADQKDGETIAIRSVALCCISTGIYGFENDAACEVALRTTRLWLEKHPAEAAKMDAIVFCVFLQKDLQLYRDMMPIFFPVEDDDDDDEEADAAEPSATESTSQNKRQKQQQQQSPRGKSAAAGASKSGAASSSSAAAAASASAAASPRLPSMGSPEFKKRKSESDDDDDDTRSETKQQQRPVAAARAGAPEVHDLCDSDDESEAAAAAAKHAAKKSRVQQ